MDRQKILFADDAPKIREVLRLLLTDEGYEVAGASSGEQTPELLDNDTDLVILDVMIPGIGGCAAYGEIRKRRSGAGAVSYC